MTASAAYYSFIHVSAESKTNPVGSRDSTRHLGLVQLRQPVQYGHHQSRARIVRRSTGLGRRLQQIGLGLVAGLLKHRLFFVGR